MLLRHLSILPLVSFVGSLFVGGPATALPQKDRAGSRGAATEVATAPLGEVLPKLVETGRTDEAIARLRLCMEGPDGCHPSPLPLLVEWLGRSGAKSADVRQRLAALKVLGNIDGAEAVLLPLLADPEPAVRAAALSALGQQQLSPAAVPALRAVLPGADADQAALLLGRLGDKSGVPVLRARLALGRRPFAYAAALKQLGDGEEALRIVRGLLRSGDQVGAGAQAALALRSLELVDDLCAAYRNAGKPERAALLNALAALGGDGRRSSGARTLVYRAFHDDSPEVRGAAVAALHAFGERDRGARYRFTDAVLEDPAAPVRARAAAALVELTGADAKDELLRAARLERAVPVRQALCKALSQHPVRGTEAALRGLLAEAAVAPACRREVEADAPRYRGATERLFLADSPLAQLEAAAEWMALYRKVR